MSSSLIGRPIHSALCHIEAKRFVNYISSSIKVPAFNGENWYSQVRNYQDPVQVTKHNQSRDKILLFAFFTITITEPVLSMGVRIHWLYPLQMNKTPTPPKRGMALNFLWWWRSSSGTRGVWITASLPLLPGPLWPGVVVRIWVPFKGQIDLFKNY